MCLRSVLETKYDIDETGMILDSGKYAGEKLYVPYFWSKYDDGESGIVYNGVVEFETTRREREIFPELDDKEIVYLQENADGSIEEVDSDSVLL